MQVPVVLTNANQSFTDTQKAQGRTNIGAASTSDLSTEITNRTNADTTLQNNINNEATARNTADTTLSNRIGTLATNLSSEIRDREAADTAINATLANAVLYTAQSSTDTEKAQARTNIGAASAADIIHTVVRNNFSFSDSASADITLYTYTAAAACLIDVTVSLYVFSNTLVGAQSYMVRFEPISDSYNTNYFSLNGQEKSAVSFRCVQSLSAGQVFRIAILNENTSYPISGSGLIMGTI